MSPPNDWDSLVYSQDDEDIGPSEEEESSGEGSFEDNSSDEESISDGSPKQTSEKKNKGIPGESSIRTPKPRRRMTWNTTRKVASKFNKPKSLAPSEKGRERKEILRTTTH